MRPYPCDKCNLAFKCRNGLKSHILSVHSETKHFVCQHCGSGFSTSSGVSRHQKQNRCSGLKALLENETRSSRQNTASGRIYNLIVNLIFTCCYNLVNQVITNGTTANVIKVEEKIPEQVDKDNTAIMQSMQYLQNIAAASTYPLSLAMQQRQQDLERQSGHLSQHQTSQINYRP